MCDTMLDWSDSETFSPQKVVSHIALKSLYSSAILSFGHICNSQISVKLYRIASAKGDETSLIGGFIFICSVFCINMSPPLN